MSTSNRPPAERVTISSRSPVSSQSPHFAKEPVFDENEETESFYVILDISGDDFAAYGKYRDGRKFRPRIGDRYYEDDESGSEDNGNTGDASSSSSSSDETAPRTQQDGDGTDPEADEDGNDSDGSRSKTSSSDDPSTRPRELTLQMLDLDSNTPLVNYEGKIYTCNWKVSNGTEMVFEPPPPPPTVEHPDQDEEADSGRKLRQNQESRLFGTTIYRLEGWPGKLKPRGRDKQEVSTKARMFAERLDAVLEHRLKEAAKNKEDMSGITMKRFSEGQQAPGSWKG